jgi:FLVCR family MFS transporter
VSVECTRCLLIRHFLFLVAQAIQSNFDWGDGQLALLPNWGTIGWFISVGPFVYVMDRRGLRPAVIAASALVFCGSVLRCFTAKSPAVTWLANAAQLLNGLAGPCGCAAPPLLSSVWFAPHQVWPAAVVAAVHPPSDCATRSALRLLLSIRVTNQIECAHPQRTTATSISTVLNYAGVALSFVIGPLLVPNLEAGSGSAGSGPTAGSYGSYRPSEQTNERYLRYQWGFAAATGVVLAAAVFTFPNRPQTPPAASAAVGRLDFAAGLRQLLRKRSFWHCALSYGCITGVYAGWGSVMADNLKAFDVTEDTSGTLGCVATLGGCVSALALSVAADRAGATQRRCLSRKNRVRRCHLPPAFLI